MEGTTEHISSAENDKESGSDLDLRGRGRKLAVEPDAQKFGRELEDTESSGRLPAEKIPVEYRELSPREPVDVNLRTLLQSGVHFGHQTARWNPAMSPYIYGSRNGIHIINLPLTLGFWEKARKSVVETASRGGSVLFVGTKKQAQDPIVEEARRSGSHYVSRRWLGGMMTNFQTIRKSIARMNRLEELLAEEEKLQADGSGSRFTKKERLLMSRERDKLYFSLGGIRDMYAPPQLIFIVDIKREDIAVKEAKRLDIPVVALVDTNCDPATVTHPIPSNDDGTRAIRLFCAAVADAVLEGKKIFGSRGAQQHGDSVQTSRKPVRKARPIIAANAGVAALMGNVVVPEEEPAPAVEPEPRPEEVVEASKEEA